MDVITSTSVNGDIPSKRIEDRFAAAVNVIRGLPKNGSYQPSNDMMLRFYSYYKQATLGPCTQKKPPFWDVVGRAKYESYKSLGKMPKDRAMELYVDELKKIIETMSYTDNVAEFMGSINELDGIDVDDLEVVAPEAIKKVKSQPNSPFASREASPIRASDRLMRYDYTNGNSYETANGHIHNGHLTTAEPSDDEYIDTVEDDPQLVEEPVRYSRPYTRRSRVSQPEMGGFHSNDADNHSTNTIVAMNNTQTVPTITQVLKMVESMRSDLQQIHSRINLLERSLSDVRNQQLRKKVNINIEISILNFNTKSSMHKSKILELRYPRWWPFTEISPTWFVFMIVWPFMAQRIMQAIQRKK